MSLAVELTTAVNRAACAVAGDLSELPPAIDQVNRLAVDLLAVRGSPARPVRVATTYLVGPIRLTHASYEAGDREGCRRAVSELLEAARGVNQAWEAVYPSRAPAPSGSCAA